MSSSHQSSPRILKVNFNQSLSPEQGFILSRVTEGMLMAELKSVLPWAEQEADAHLQDLIRKGALVLEHAVAKEQPFESLENGDLDPSFVNELNQRWECVKTHNPFEILDLARNASDLDVRTQYLALSKNFHPDRFFKKNLGSYAERLNLVFAEINKAYRSIKNPHDREAMNLKFKEASPKKDDLSKEQLLDKLKSDPNLEKWVRAEEAYQEGLRLEREHQLLKALNCFTLALQLNPKRIEYKRAHEALTPLLKMHRAEEKLREAVVAAATQLTSEAFELSAEALKLNPELADAQLLWSKCVVDLQRTELLRDARERLRRAKVALPKDPGPCFYLGKLHLLQGDRKLAIQELKEALLRDPKHTEAQRILDEI